MNTFRALVLVWPLFLSGVASAQSIEWRGWSGDLFQRAKAENRLVILDLEAVWCHWCHVMEQKTYADPKVGALISSRYLAVRADQDADLELSSRYGDWGWPATIVFAPDGTELAKLRGYIEPERLASLLQAFIDDPSPGPSAVAEAEVKPAASPFLSDAQRAELKQDVDDGYDPIHGGWGGVQRFIDADAMDDLMARAEKGDKEAERRARKTFGAALALIDPVWGGVYQYSDKEDWSSPHFEKIMSFQAQYLRQYSQAFARWRDPAYLKAASAIYAYMTRFLLTPEGAFEVSQDADLDGKTDGHAYYALNDAERRKLGLPRIDPSLYASANGQAISALAAFYDATGAPESLAIARRAADWVKNHRALEGGGFRHGGSAAAPALADNLAMGQAFIDLYAATGDRQDLRDAAAAGTFIGLHFKDEAGGFDPVARASGQTSAFARPVKQIDDQIATARFMNLLARYTGDAKFAGFAAHAMRFAMAQSDEIERPLPGLLLADSELGRVPTHITIVGAKDDRRAQTLGAVARAFPATYRRLDWWDPREGPLDNPDVAYPDMDQPAAFACGDRICSLPAFSADELKSAVQRMAALGKPK